jgi:A/G-specific adenine glycosylase
MNKLPIRELKHWFEEEKRDLPWRGKFCPYGVWVSEIMLQQTQVAVVIPYFERWMTRFPTIESLAAASIEEVIKLWEGLGYYSRARNLHKGSRYVVSRHGGKLPEDAASLSKIPGLGPYTTGAILSFAFHQKAPAVDGNVMRVLARFIGLEEDISLPATRKRVQAVTEAFLPDHEPWVIMEALIELGALVCKRDPQCGNCPLQRDCAAYLSGREKELPIKGKQADTIPLIRDVVIIRWQNLVLVRKGIEGQIMADLYEFPYFEREEAEVAVLIEKKLGLTCQYQHTLSPVKQTFTRYRAQLFPTVWEAKQKRDVPGYQWVSEEALLSYPFSSGHRRILNSLKAHDAHFAH